MAVWEAEAVKQEVRVDVKEYVCRSDLNGPRCVKQMAAPNDAEQTPTTKCMFKSADSQDNRGCLSSDTVAGVKLHSLAHLLLFSVILSKQKWLGSHVYKLGLPQVPHLVVRKNMETASMQCLDCLREFPECVLLQAKTVPVAPVDTIL